MGWFKRFRRSGEDQSDPETERLYAERIGRIATRVREKLAEPLPPPPPPTILLLAPPNYRIEFISRFHWNGGINPYDTVPEVKERKPREDWLERPSWRRGSTGF